MFVSVQFKLENKENKEKVLSLMRLQSAAIRFIYSRLKEGKQEKVLTRDFSSLKPILV